jgi:hypothetical protein
MAFIDARPVDAPTHEVTAPSGAKYSLLTAEEAHYFLDKVGRYTTDNKFFNVSDLQDLDRIILMETLSWRWSAWLLKEVDYWGDPIDLKALRDSLKEYSNELRQLKKMMGIDKAARDRERGESAVDYLENLRIRAKEFGVMREKQLTKAITLFKELQSLVTLHQNCTERERAEQDVELTDIFEWLVNIAFPEFEAIDGYFVEHSQRFWVREL